MSVSRASATFLASPKAPERIMDMLMSSAMTVEAVIRFSVL